MKVFGIIPIITMSLLMVSHKATSGVIFDEYLVKEYGIPRVIRFESGTILEDSSLPFLLVYQVDGSAPLYHLKSIEVDFDQSTITGIHHDGRLLNYELIERSTSLENAILQGRFNPKGLYYRFYGGVFGSNEIHLEYNHLGSASTSHQRLYCTECLLSSGKYTIKSEYYDPIMKRLVNAVFASDEGSTLINFFAP